jgi:hypothetical protein
MASEEPRWLVEPGPGEVNIQVAVDEAAELTPALREALDGLVKALQEEEVGGYTLPQAKKCPHLHNCDVDGNCRPLVSSPCARFSSCRIVC